MKKVLFTKLVTLLILCSFVNVVNGGVSIISDMEVVGSLRFQQDTVPLGNVYVCSSEDGGMKFYSWEVVSDGICQNYAVICQFLNKDGKIVTEDFRVREEEPGWVSQVHSIKKNDGSTYYITTRKQRTSSNVGFTWMEGFAIDGDTLRSVSVLDGGDDLDECVLEINYKIDDWNLATDGEGWDWLFEFDSETMDLYVPNTIYIDDSIPSLNDRYRLYHFNGMEFAYQGEGPHKGLHASLHSYARLVKYFRTENHIVRIDELESGSYRFASWKSTADMSENPETVINDGMYEERNDYYIFVKEGVEYKVDYDDETPCSDCIYRHHEFLIVQKDGETLLKEERIFNTD